MTRREAFRLLMGFAAGSPLFAQGAPDEDVNGPVNIHEFEEIAKRKLHKLAYDFIAGGVEDGRGSEGGDGGGGEEVAAGGVRHGEMPSGWDAAIIPDARGV